MSLLVFVCFGVAMSLSFYEFVGVFIARVKGRTKSTGRVVLRGLVFGTVVVLFWHHLDWSAYLLSFSNESLENARLENTPFLLGSISYAFVLSLLGFELIALHRARKAKRTTNRSRLISGIIILFCLVPILRDTVLMWDRYTAKLSAGYVEPGGTP